MPRDLLTPLGSPTDLLPGDEAAQPSRPVIVPSIKRGVGQLAGEAGITLEDIGRGLGRPWISRAGETLSKKGAEITSSVPTEIQKPSDILKKPWTLVKEAVGELTPRIGAYAAGVKGGATLGRIGGPAGVVIGGQIGGLGALGVQMYGAARQQQQEAGTDDVPRALLAAAGMTALERAGAEQLVHRAIKGSPLRALSASRIGSIATGALRTGAVEGPLTELPQTVLERWAARQPLTDQQALDEYTIATAKGAAGGGVVGGVAGTLAPLEAKQTTPSAEPSDLLSEFEDAPPVEPPPVEPPPVEPPPVEPPPPPVESPPPVEPPRSSQTSPDISGLLYNYRKRTRGPLVRALERASSPQVGALVPLNAQHPGLARVHEAATSPLNDLSEPSEAQKKAGNYRKGPVKWRTHEFSIENPIGSVRRGEDNGRPWEVPMQAHYGYIKGTQDRTGEQIDVYLTEELAEDSPVFIIDQEDPRTGNFDEHKVVIGPRFPEQAAQVYDAHFSDGSGPSRRRGVTQLTPEQFDRWLAKGDHTKAFRPRRKQAPALAQLAPLESLRVTPEGLAVGAQSELGLTPDVAIARRRHPGAAPDRRPVPPQRPVKKPLPALGAPKPAPALRVSPEGQVLARGSETGLTGDVEMARRRHPGASANIGVTEPGKFSPIGKREERMIGGERVSPKRGPRKPVERMIVAVDATLEGQRIKVRKAKFAGRGVQGQVVKVQKRLAKSGLAVLTPEGVRVPLATNDVVEVLPAVTKEQEGAYAVQSRGLNVEVAPDPRDVNLSRAFASLDWDERMALTREVAGTIIPQVLARLGLRGLVQYTAGGWQGASNPSIIVRTPANASQEQMEQAARALGYVLRQQAVVAYDESRIEGDGMVGFVRVVPREKTSPEAAAQLYARLHQQVAEADGYTFRDGAMVFANFSELTNEQFADKLAEALEKEDAVYDIQTKQFWSQLQEIDHDSGQAQQLEEGRPAVPGRQRGGPDFAELQRQASRLLADGLRRRSPARVERGARQVRGQEAPRVLTDAERVALTTREEMPVDEDGNVLLVHWGRTHDVSALRVQYHGTGVPTPALKERRTSDNYLPRLYFGYTSNDGRAYVRERALSRFTARYEVRLDAGQVYDLITDPLGLKGRSRRADGSLDFEQYERNIQAAGMKAAFNSHLNQAVLYEDTPPSRYIDERKGDVREQAYGPAPRKVREAGAGYTHPQTQTKEFKLWFGKSKIVDKNGLPLVSYHGTSAEEDFETFVHRDLGFHFGTLAAAHERLRVLNLTAYRKKPARIMPVWLRIENPLRIADMDWSLPFNWYIEARDAGSNLTLALRKAIFELTNKFVNPTTLYYLRGRTHRARFAKQLIALLKQHGYDGIRYINDHEDAGSESFIAFDPEQIKSAVGNIGAFSSASSIVRQGAEYGVSTEQLELFPKEQKRAFEQAKKAVRSMAERWKNISVLGSRIAADFKARGTAPLLGQQIESAADLAALAQIYRDPRIETFRWFITAPDGQVTYQTGVTMRMPGATAFAVGQTGADRAAFVRQVLAEAQRIGGTLWLLHNHPSGDSGPSQADVDATVQIAALAKKSGVAFGGHVVINHNEYSQIDAAGATQENISFSPSVESYGKTPRKRHAFLGETVLDDTDVVALAQEVANAQAVVLVGRQGGSTGTVGLVAEVSPETLDASPRSAALLRKLMREHGITSLVALNVPDELREAAVKGIQSGLLVDAVMASEPTVTLRTESEIEPLRTHEFGQSTLRQKGVRAEEREAAYATPAIGAREGQPLPGRVTNDRIAQHFTEQHALRHGRELDPSNEQDYAQIVEWAAEEARYQLATPETGEHWYAKDFDQAVAIARREIPSLSRAGNRRFFSVLVALLSNGNSVQENWDYAIEVYKQWEATGIIPARKPNGTPWGAKQGPTIEKQLRMLQSALRQKGSPGALAKYLLSTDTVEALTRFRRLHGMKGPPSDIRGGKDARYQRAYLFGQKLGAYILNLNGLNTDVVLDRWLARTFYRHTGNMQQTLWDAGTSSVGVVQTPKQAAHRPLITGMVERVARRIDKSARDTQAILWVFEQQTWATMGHKSAISGSYHDAAKTRAARRKNTTADTRRGSSVRRAHRAGAGAGRQSVATQRVPAKAIKGTKRWEQLTKQLRELQGRYKSFDAYYRAATEAHYRLQGKLATVARASGTDIVLRPGGEPKARESTQAKLQSKYQGDLTQLTDVASAMLVVDTPNQARAALALLADEYEVVVPEGWVATKAGYWDQKVLVADNETGITGEVLIVPRPLYVAREVIGGHALYKQPFAPLQLQRALYELASADAGAAWVSNIDVWPEGDVRQRYQRIRKTGASALVVPESDAQLSALMARYSQMLGLPGQGMTVETVEQLLTESLGSLPKGLTVVQSIEDLPESLQGANVLGVYSDPDLGGDGTTYLVADNLSAVPDSERHPLYVWLHEAEHARLKDMLGDPLYTQVLKRVRAAQNEDTPLGRAVRAARRRVPTDTLPEYVESETLAYLVQDPANHRFSLVRQILAAVRKWLFENGFVGAEHLGTPELVLLVRAAAQANRSLPPPGPVGKNLRAWMETDAALQLEAMYVRARQDGFASLDEWAQKNTSGYLSFARQWREGHPLPARRAYVTGAQSRDLVARDASGSLTFALVPKFGSGSRPPMLPVALELGHEPQRKGSTGFGALHIYMRHHDMIPPDATYGSPQYIDGVVKYVADITQNYQAAYRDTKDGRVILMKDGHTVVLTPRKGVAYTVTTAYPRGSYSLQNRLESGRWKVLVRPGGPRPDATPPGNPRAEKLHRMDDRVADKLVARRSVAQVQSWAEMLPPAGELASYQAVVEALVQRGEAVPVLLEQVQNLETGTWTRNEILEALGVNLDENMAGAAGVGGALEGNLRLGSGVAGSVRAGDVFSARAGADQGPGTIDALGAARGISERDLAMVAAADALLEQFAPGRFARDEGPLPGAKTVSQAARDDLKRVGAKVSPAMRQAAASSRGALQRRAGAVVDWLDSKTSPLARMVGAERYLAERYRTLGRVAKSQETARALYNTFRGADAKTARAIYAYLTDANNDGQQIPDPRMRENAMRAKALIMRVGKDLVAHGVIPQESFEAHKGQYLPRIYLAYMLGDRAVATVGAGKTLSARDYAKRRKLGDTPEDKHLREVILGEIKDPAFLLARAFGVPVRDLAVLQLLEYVANDPEWTLPKQLVDWASPFGSKPHKVTPWWLKNEAQRLRQRAQLYQDPTIKAQALAEAGRMDLEADTALSAVGVDAEQTPGGYAKIPNSPRYGAMRGLIVRKEVYDDMIGIGRAMSEHASLPERLLGYGGVGTKVTQFWKWLKVPANPPAQVRNIVSNLVLLNLSGVPMHRIPALMVRAVHEVATRGEFYQLGMKYGQTASTFAAQEVLRVDREALDFLKRQQGQSVSLFTLYELGAKIMDWTGDRYQDAEMLGKIAKMIHGMEKEGLSEEQAAIEAQKWLFDYSLVPTWLGYLRNAPIGGPFLTFSVKVIPRIIEAAVKRPHYFLPYYALIYGMAALAAASAGGDTDDLEKLKQALPEFIRDRGHVMALPGKDKHGRWRFVDVGYFFPWAMWTDMASDLARIPKAIATEDGFRALSDTFTSSGLLGGPIPSTIAFVMSSGVDPFTKRRVYDESAPAGEQIMGVLSWLWTQATPTFLSGVPPFHEQATFKGAAGHVYEALTGHTDRYGAPRNTVPQALARFAGINTYPVDPQESLRRNLLYMQYDLADTRRRMRSRLRDKSLAPERRREIADEYREKMRYMNEQVRKYRESAEVPPHMQ